MVFVGLEVAPRIWHRAVIFSLAPYETLVLIQKRFSDVPLTPDRKLQVRIAAALALVVGVNGFLFSVLAWSALHVLSASGRSASIDIDLPFTLGTVLLGAVGLAAIQARYGSRTVISGLDLDKIGGNGPRNITGRVRRQATQADVPLPSIAVADHPEPSCLTVGTQRSPTIVLTKGLLEQLDDDELDAALAHEVAHIANRDLPVVTAVAATVAIGDRLLERERLLRRVLWNMSWIAIITGIGLLVLAVPILITGVTYLVVSTVARTLLGVNTIALGLFSKTREYAADRGAIQLTGDPAALASALETLEGERPSRDARVHASATLGIVAQPLSFEEETDDEDHWLERWFTGQISFERVGEPNVLERGLERIGRWFHATAVVPVTTRVRRVLSWRPPTHPATEDRIDQLRMIEQRKHG